jgi:hypothetical protein
MTSYQSSLQQSCHIERKAGSHMQESVLCSGQPDACQRAAFPGDRAPARRDGEDGGILSSCGIEGGEKHGRDARDLQRLVSEVAATLGPLASQQAAERLKVKQDEAGASSGEVADGVLADVKVYFWDYLYLSNR